MQAYQQRVLTEKEELDEKIRKLEHFIFEKGTKWVDVPQQERLRMLRQYCLMSEYSAVLGERISNFGFEPPIGDVGGFHD